MKKLQSVIQHHNAQYKHELKKKERDYNKLKERLQKLLTDRTPDRKVGKYYLYRYHHRLYYIQLQSALCLTYFSY